MSVRQSLLAILDQGPCYGYQLRAEFARRTGSVRPLNVGQIYNTLDRLERDGLVAKGEVDEHGHVYWRITDAGSADVRRWLASPSPRTGAARDDLAIKLALAATLPGVDVAEVIEAQRAEAIARLARLDAEALERGTDAESLPASIVHDAQTLACEAELRWLDRTEERLLRHPEHAQALELSTERPKRGRPARAEAPAPVS